MYRHPVKQAFDALEEVLNLFDRRPVFKTSECELYNTVKQAFAREGEARAFLRHPESYKATQHTPDPAAPCISVFEANTVRKGLKIGWLYSAHITGDPTPNAHRITNLRHRAGMPEAQFQDGKWHAVDQVRIG